MNKLLNILNSLCTTYIGYDVRTIVYQYNNKAEIGFILYNNYLFLGLIPYSNKVDVFTSRENVSIHLQSNEFT